VAGASGIDAAAGSMSPTLPCEDLPVPDDTWLPMQACQGLEGMYVVRPSTGLYGWFLEPPIYVWLYEEAGACRAWVNVEYSEPAQYEVRTAPGALSLVPADGAAGAVLELGWYWYVTYAVESITLPEPAGDPADCARVDFSYQEDYIDDWHSGRLLQAATVARETPPVVFALRRSTASSLEWSEQEAEDFAFGSWVLQPSRPVQDLASHVRVLDAETGDELPAAVQPLGSDSLALIQFSDWLAVNGRSFAVAVDEAVTDLVGEAVAPAQLAGKVILLPGPAREYVFDGTGEAVWLDGTPSTWIQDGLLHVQERDQEEGVLTPACQAAGLLDISGASVVRFLLPAGLWLGEYALLYRPGYDRVECRASLGDGQTASDQPYTMDCLVDGGALAAFCAYALHPDGEWAVEAIRVE
jgi:hypothetical protein